MNLHSTLIISFFLVVVAGGFGVYKYNEGWNNGRQNLIKQQQDKAQAKLAKRVQRQQSNDQKAADADQQGTAKTVTITRDVIKYVKTPNRTVCKFDPVRVSIKSASVDNANTIKGYDE